MTTLRYGSLFSGYNGLDLGVQSVLGGETAWFCEFDKAPSAILAHHWPDVPNLGDITKVDWSTVEPVDVLTGGSPCQDLSHAGKRAGMSEGTRSNLWVQMREAIAALRPRLIVWENVRGALSAEATSDLEPCAGCVGDPGDGQPVLRALGRVLGDLAELGYDARWYGLRAADVGAAHGRFRVFLFAVPADADDTRLEGLTDSSGAAQAGRRGHVESGAVGPDLTLLPTPVSDNSRGLPSSGTDYASLPNAVVSLLPTPTSADANSSGGSNASNVTLTDATVRTRMGTTANERLLPTPEAADGSGGRKSAEFGGHRESGAKRAVTLATAIDHRWGDYAAAVARWEHVIGRPAPPPTEFGAARLNRHGNPSRNPRLSPFFVEWLMGLPAGHVTDPAIGLTRSQALKALGNGVVPQQAAAATEAFLHDLAKERAA